jgi:hypothetical protein
MYICMYLFIYKPIQQLSGLIQTSRRYVIMSRGSIKTCGNKVAFFLEFGTKQMVSELLC